MFEDICHHLTPQRRLGGTAGKTDLVDLNSGIFLCTDDIVHLIADTFHNGTSHICLLCSESHAHKGSSGIAVDPGTGCSLEEGKECHTVCPFLQR